ncbi:MAG: TetR family transcriptional regulator C-terminal domain-containing protein, partial [Candidatus Nanopelagicales bacterium]
AAASVIAEQGLANLRISDVADRAGMTVGHVTYYFPSKNELLVRAIRHSELEFQANVHAQLARRHDPWARLRALIAAASATGPKDPGWMLWFEVWANAVSDPALAAIQQELAGWWQATLAEVVADGIADGVFHTDDPTRAVAVISGLTDGLSVRLALSDGDFTRKRMLSLIIGTAEELVGR